MVPRATTHEDRLHRRRPRRPVLRAADEAAAIRRTTSPWSSATSPTTPSAGAWCSPTRRWTTCAQWDPRHRRRDPAGLQPLGRHRAALQGPRHPLAAATASSASGARSCSTSCRRAARSSASKLRVRDRGRVRRRLPRRRPGHRQRRHQLAASAASYADVFKPDIVTRPNRFIWLGTNKLYDAFTFAVREDRARLVPGPHLQVRRQDHDLHRRDARARLEGARPGHGRPGRVDRLLREAVRRATCSGAQADDQRAPPARLGLAELPARDLRAVVALQRPRAMWC